MATQPTRILSAPGIKRDGTMLEGEGYVDGRWVRFDRGLPRKIPGYRSINRLLTGPPRTINAYVRDNLVYAHFGSATKIERMTVDAGFSSSIITDRTPASLVQNANNLWQFDVSAFLDDNFLVAQVAPNLLNITNSVGGQLFVGDLFATTPPVEVTLTGVPVSYTKGYPNGTSLTGGVMVLFPYTVVFGSAGWVMWSVPNDPADYVGAGAGNANVTGQKIVAGLPLRGSGLGPSGLLWSADSLIRMTYTGPDASGGGPLFSFDTISAQSSIMSSTSVLEYDGVYYWVGVDRFLMFNGVVREVENKFNKDFFFDNLNWVYRQKVFVFKVPRWGEIWWCFPFGDSVEPNHAVIYNIRENTWYDTPLPGLGRSAANFPQVFRYPIMIGVDPQIYSLKTVTVANAGTGYVVGNVLTVVGGAFTTPSTLTVAAVSGGQITAVTITTPGAYTTPPVSPVAVTGGGGTGATFTTLYTSLYKLWLHEIGTDEIDGLSITPVESFFETGEIGLPPASNKWTRVVMVEPDFVQSGVMTAQVKGRANARAPEVDGPAMAFPEVAATPDEQVLLFKEERRELRFRFSSNTLGGDYLMGLTLAHIGPGDGTVIT